MVKTEKIIDILEEFAPLDLQEDWDNSGWQINLRNSNVNKIMLSLNVTESVVEQAKQNNCDLIISHHPMIFSPQKCIRNKAIISAIQNNIQVYSLHTNFDKAENGTTDILSRTLGYENTVKINDYVKYTNLEIPKDLDEIIDGIKKALGINKLKCSNYQKDKKISRIAFCAGAGGSFVRDLSAYNIDCFVTGDVKYHDALESNTTLIDIGHFESEKISLKKIKEILSDLEVEIISSKEESIFEII